MKSRAIKTAMRHEPVKVEAGARKETKATKEQPKPKADEPKLPPGVKAINSFWTKVIKRDAGEDDEERVLQPSIKTKCKMSV